MPAESREGRPHFPKQIRFAGIVLAGLLSGATALAQPSDPPPRPSVVEEVPSEVAALEQRVQVLEEQARAKEAAKKLDGATVRAVPGKGLTVTSSDGNYALSVGARIQVRSAFVDGPLPATNDTSIRTLRFLMGGHVLTPDLRYALQLAFAANDFEKDTPSPIFNAYAEYVGLRDLNVRVGQFFVPFDRARTMREFALQFVDRPTVIRELALDRDVGLMLSSTDLFGTKVLGYHAYVGSGEGKNRTGGLKPGPLAVGRLVLRPWGMFDDDIEADIGREMRPRLAIGVAGAYNLHTGRQNSTFGTTFTQGTVDYEHLVADLLFKYGGFSLLAEVLSRRANVDSVSGMIDGKIVREVSRSGYGYTAQAGMMVHRLVEVVARWEQIIARSGTDPAFHKQVDQTGKQVGGGANVYLNGHAFKLQTDYVYAFGDAPDGTHTFRVQVDASF